MIITLDGPAGTGKTTVAKNLAEELGYTYFDTGAMYRAITYGVIEYKVDISNLEALQQFLESHPVRIESHFNDKRIFLGDEDVTQSIRTKEVTDLVSRVSAIACVRQKLVATQRELSQGVNAVFEGRDMGTVVFPNAEIKVFLTASLEERAKRRYKELLEKDPTRPNLTLETVLNDIDSRDKYDASRDISPMKPASDAVIIDTSNLTIADVINQIIILSKEEQDKPLTSA